MSSRRVAGSEKLHSPEGEAPSERSLEQGGESSPPMAGLQSRSSGRRFVMKQWSTNLVQRTGSFFRGGSHVTRAGDPHVRFRDRSESVRSGAESAMEDLRLSGKSVTSGRVPRLGLPLSARPTSDRESQLVGDKKRREKEFLSRGERRRKREEEALTLDLSQVAIRSMRPAEARVLQQGALQSAFLRTVHADGSPKDPGTLAEDTPAALGIGMPELIEEQGAEELTWAQHALRFCFNPSASGVIHPRSAFARVWSFVRLVASVAIFFTATWEVAFAAQSGGFRDMNGLRLVEIISETLCIFDVFIMFNLGYFKDSAVIMDRSLVRVRYTSGRLFLDLVSIFPVLTEIPGVNLGDPFIRLLHCLKIINSREDLLYFVRITADSCGAAVTLMGALIFFFFGLVHIVGCIWFTAMSRQTCPRNFSEDLNDGLLCSWIGHLPDLQHETLAWVEGTSSYAEDFRLYLATIYWASGASNNFESTTTYERLTATFAHISISLIFGAFIVANAFQVLTVFQSGWNRNLQYHQKMDDINKLMRRALFPRDLQQEIRGYYQDSWLRKQVDISDRVLLQELPNHVREKVLLHLARQLLEASDFFVDFIDNEDGEGHLTADHEAASPHHSLLAPNSARSRKSEERPARPHVASTQRRLTILTTRRNLHEHTYSKDAMRKITMAANKLDHPDGGGHSRTDKKPRSLTARKVRLDPPVSDEEKNLWTETLASKLYPVTFSPGEIVFMEGDTTDLAMYIIKSGSVSMAVNGHVAATLSSGSYFGELATSLAFGSRRVTTARANIFTECFKLNKEDMEQIWAKFPRLKTLNLQAVYARHQELGLPMPKIDATPPPPQTTSVEGGRLERKSIRTPPGSAASGLRDSFAADLDADGRAVGTGQGPITGALVRDVWRNRVLQAQKVQRRPRFTSTLSDLATSEKEEEEEEDDEGSDESLSESEVGLNEASRRNEFASGPDSMMSDPVSARPSGDFYRAPSTGSTFLNGASSRSLADFDALGDVGLPFAQQPSPNTGHVFRPSPLGPAPPLRTGARPQDSLAPPRALQFTPPRELPSPAPASAYAYASPAAFDPVGLARATPGSGSLYLGSNASLGNPGRQPHLTPPPSGGGTPPPSFLLRMPSELDGVEEEDEEDLDVVNSPGPGAGATRTPDSATSKTKPSRPSLQL